jgi:hypothetical protein
MPGRIHATAEKDPEGPIIVEMNSPNAEQAFMLRENAARRLLIDLLHATEMEVPEDE